MRICSSAVRPSVSTMRRTDKVSPVWLVSRPAALRLSPAMAKRGTESWALSGLYDFMRSCFLSACLRYGVSVCVAGATGSGKTTVPAAADDDEIGVPAGDVVRISHFEGQTPRFVGRQAGFPECVVVEIGAQRVRHAGLERESVAARPVPVGGFDEDDPVCGPRPVDCCVRVPDEVHRQDASLIEVRQRPVVGYAVHDDHRGLAGDCARSPHLYPGGHARERTCERFRFLVEFCECHFRCDRRGIGLASHHGLLSGLSVSYDHDLFQCVVIFFQGDVIVVAGDQFGGEIPVADITDDERSPSRVRKGEFSVRIRDGSDVSPVDLHRCPGNGLPIRVAHGARDDFARQVGFADASRVPQRVVPLRDRGLIVGQRGRDTRNILSSFPNSARLRSSAGSFMSESIRR